MAAKLGLRLFEAVGVELEYMIVEGGTLTVRPICDQLLAGLSGAGPGEVTGDLEYEDISWSNELTLHVLEFKTTLPPRELSGVAAQFQAHVARANAALRPYGARLLPGAVHPWMDPYGEMVLWPHDNHEIYHAFNQIFDCRGHGWANLQSLHLNLPFTGDEEFGRLHAAIRLILPLLPALAASSPVVDGRATGLLDNRLEAYRHHCDRLPILTGRVIPEPVFTIADYEREILGAIYAGLAPHDPTGVLQEEWANARGAIARFERDTIEIRVLDVQECPAADLAIAALTVATLQSLAAEVWSSQAEQRALPVAPLAALFEATLRDAEATPVTDAAYCRLLGWTGPACPTAGELWGHLLAQAERRQPALIAPHAAALATLRRHGPLARRLLTRLGPCPSPARLRATWSELADCLATGQLFTP